MFFRIDVQFIHVGAANFESVWSAASTYLLRPNSRKSNICTNNTKALHHRDKVVRYSEGIVHSISGWPKCLKVFWRGSIQTNERAVSSQHFGSFMKRSDLYPKSNNNRKRAHSCDTRINAITSKGTLGFNGIAESTAVFQSTNYLSMDSTISHDLPIKTWAHDARMNLPIRSNGNQHDGRIYKIL